MFSRFVLIIVFFITLIPVTLASDDVFDPYYARRAPRRASEVQHIVSSARFLLDSDPTQSTQSVLCSVQRSLPFDRGGGFYETVAQNLVQLFPGESQEEVLISLLRHDRCASQSSLEVQHPRKRPKILIHFDDARRIVSSNPVWNACVRRDHLSHDLIQMNTDIFIHRQGSVLKKIPYTCRDYHRGSDNLWIYPDQPGLQIYIDNSARFLGILPSSLDGPTP